MDRIRKTFDIAFEGWALREYERRLSFLKQFLVLCESPIEQQLLAAMMCMEIPFIDGHPSVPRTVEIAGTFHEIEPHGRFLAIVPQAKIGRYRVDFLLIAKFNEAPPVRLVAVECDGHDFHQKTKQQAARDKSRDRELLLGGVPVLRFTGSEIYADASACADEIASLIFDTWHKATVD